MTAQSFDIAVLGSGFGGSLLSTLLAKSGLKVALLDRSRHPRFAIGESSTPLADSTLASIADEFGLPELKPLSQYGSWKRTHPEITCGLKRGFSYFQHSPDEHINANDILLVAASNSNEHSDTHWLRSDVDAFFFKVAQSYGVNTFENVMCRLSQSNDMWQLDNHTGNDESRLTADFVVDATGSPNAVLGTLNVADISHTLNTNSAAIFAHFANVRPVAEILAQARGDQASHPFPCDAAAVHHVLDDGWMWQLPFDDGTVSCGLVLDQRRASIMPADMANPTLLWHRMLQQYPSLTEQFADASIVRPENGLRATGRRQRLAEKAAGRNWAALPATVGFVDPLHSTGIAHTLFAVRRLAKTLTAKTDAVERHKKLKTYSQRIIDEIQIVDELVEGCYAALPDFRLWSAWCMLYFAAVTSMEQTSNADHDVSFLRADDPKFRETVKTARQQLDAAVSNSSPTASRVFEDWLKAAIAPWNHVGLLDSSAEGMYTGTVAPRRT